MKDKRIKAAVKESRGMRMNLKGKSFWKPVVGGDKVIIEFTSGYKPYEDKEMAGGYYDFIRYWIFKDGKIYKQEGTKMDSFRTYMNIRDGILKPVDNGE